MLASFFVFPRKDSDLCVYHWCVWPNGSHCHCSQGITLPTQLCLLEFFWANLLYSLFHIIFHIVYIRCPSSFCLSWLFYRWFLWFLLFCATINKRDSVSLYISMSMMLTSHLPPSFLLSLLTSSIRVKTLSLLLTSLVFCSVQPFTRPLPET